MKKSLFIVVLTFGILMNINSSQAFNFGTYCTPGQGAPSDLPLKFTYWEEKCHGGSHLGAEGNTLKILGKGISLKNLVSTEYHPADTYDAYAYFEGQMVLLPSGAWLDPGESRFVVDVVVTVTYKEDRVEFVIYSEGFSNEECSSYHIGTPYELVTPIEDVFMRNVGDRCIKASSHVLEGCFYIHCD